MLDCVSALICDLQHSLSLGMIRCCKFSVEFRLDVFRHLFEGKGSTPLLAGEDSTTEKTSVKSTLKKIPS